MTSPGDEFKVTDRRRRDSEEEPTAVPLVDTPTRSDAPVAPPSEPAPAAPVSPSDTERSLEGLFMMLGSSAMVALGSAPDPVSGEVRRDPAIAADAIDLLVLLREKTEGNLSPAESQLLGELIYDLQIRYVAAMRSSR